MARRVLMADDWHSESFSDTAMDRYGFPEFNGKSYTLIKFGRCNMRCGFCFRDGANADADGRQPNSRYVDFEDIADLVVKQVKEGQIMRISGGEPGLYPTEVTELLNIIKENGGYSIIDTNGTIPSSAKRYAELADVMSIDGPKCSLGRVEKITNVPRKICWDLPLETMKISKGFPCRMVEYKAVLLDPLDYEHLSFLAENIPEDAILTLKSYREVMSKDLSDGSNIEKIINDGLHSVGPEEICGAAERLIKEHQSMKGRVMAILGSTRKKGSYRGF